MNLSSIYLPNSIQFDEKSGEIKEMRQLCYKYEWGRDIKLQAHILDRIQTIFYKSAKQITFVVIPKGF
jgi:hypothetical protein